MRAPPEAANRISGRLLARPRPRAPDDQRLAGGHAQRAAHEVEVLHGGDHRHAVDACRRRRGSRPPPVLVARVLQPVGVALLVAELQRIDRRPSANVDVSQAAVVEEVLRSARRAASACDGRIRADVLVGLEIAVEDHLAASRALDPEILRHRRGAAEHQLIFGRTKLVIQFMQQLLARQSMRQLMSAGASRAARRPAASSRTRSRPPRPDRRSAALRRRARRRRRRQIAEPTTTPSAMRPMAARLLGGAGCRSRPRPAGRCAA